MPQSLCLAVCAEAVGGTSIRDRRDSFSGMARERIPLGRGCVCVLLNGGQGCFRRAGGIFIEGETPEESWGENG